MDTAELIRTLSDPAAYPHPAFDIEVHQTHISVVFLAGAFAYKIKKPLDLGFLDFTTLERRKFYCEEEVRLNRRLAPEAYLGVVPVRRSPGGGLSLHGTGEVVEWAVQMVRLPEEATLLVRLQRREDLAEVFTQLGHHLRAFHEHAETGQEISGFGRRQVIADNALENFEQAAPLAGRTVSEEVLQRLETRTRQLLVELGELLDQRVRAGRIRDTHGDLHLDHVYWFPDESREERFVIVDCIEFNRRFRYADPIADLAFLMMDLKFHHHPEWGEVLADAYFEAAGDPGGRRLLSFYTAYRAAVRGKVEGFEVAETEVPPSERGRALSAARAHWLLALGELESAPRRPALVCVAGLPGSGKSTLARALEEDANFNVIASDRVRKELAGIDPSASAASAFGEGIYTDRWNDRTYSACLRRARESLFRGERVIVDASFREEHRRQEFLQEARDLCVPELLLQCVCGEEEARRRLQGRNGGLSDADWEIYLGARSAWQPAAAATAQASHEIHTDGGEAASLRRAADLLEREGLL